jgi:hypothetical protein
MNNDTNLSKKLLQAKRRRDMETNINNTIPEPVFAAIDLVMEKIAGFRNKNVPERVSDRIKKPPVSQTDILNRMK